MLLHTLSHKKDHHLYFKDEKDESSGGAPCLEPGSQVVIKLQASLPCPLCGTTPDHQATVLTSLSAKPKPISSAMCSRNKPC